jgi:hypothetical protein
MAISVLLDRPVTQRPNEIEISSENSQIRAPLAITIRRATAVLLAVAAAFPLAAAQLVPTARLARLAANQRDFEYLSGFAATPFHLVSFVAPGLFHRSPLWRPVVWDPFHTSPEENLAYIGLVPLLLAISAIKRGIRNDRSVRFLTLLAAISLFLSLGPYVPGFRWLIGVPGFSFFRAPARWNLLSALALAMLAGKGFDGWQATRQSAQGLIAFIIIAALWIALTISLIELAVASTAPRASSSLSSYFDHAFRAMPWSGDPSFDPPDPSFAAVMAEARRPTTDPRIPSILAQKNQQNQTFVKARTELYLNELHEPAALLIALATIAWLIRKQWLDTQRARVALVLLTLIDLCVLGRHRLIDIGPLAPLASQSPLLASLAKEPRASRSADRFGNLPMIAGIAPISAYRTLTLPAVESLTAMTRPHLSDPRVEPLVQQALRATGLSLRIFDPIENRLEHLLHRQTDPRESIEDPTMARWIYGANWTDQQADWAKTFTIWKSKLSATRAWQIPITDASAPILEHPWSGDPREILTLFESASPLIAKNPNPESWSIEVDGTETESLVVISQLADPQWNAYWISRDNDRRFDDVVRPVFFKNNEPGGWQSVRVPGKGHWTLHLEYEALDLAQGAAISTVAWVTWLLLLIVGFRVSVAKPRAVRPRPARGEREG